MSELSSCPFCGKSDDLKINDATRILGNYNLIHRCKVIGPIKIESVDEPRVSEIWNTRATTPTASELVEALRNIREKASQGMSHGLTADAICEDIMRLADAALATEAGRSALKQEGKT